MLVAGARAHRSLKKNMLTRKSIREVEDLENKHHSRIKATFRNRDQGDSSRKEWHDATSAWHNQIYPTDVLWTDDFMSDLRGSKRSAIEQAILYLEVDPWYFRSGYLKERLIRGLKACKISETDRRRLWNVVWNVAAGRNRREFRNYCSLASIIVDADLLRLLEEVTPERDERASGKFTYLLNYLRKHTKQEANKSHHATTGSGCVCDHLS